MKKSTRSLVARLLPLAGNLQARVVASFAAIFQIFRSASNTQSNDESLSCKTPSPVEIPILDPKNYQLLLLLFSKIQHVYQSRNPRTKAESSPQYKHANYFSGNLTKATSKIQNCGNFKFNPKAYTISRIDPTIRLSDHTFIGINVGPMWLYYQTKQKKKPFTAHLSAPVLLVEHH